ncbi:MAG: hypothetical protein ACHQE5_13220 [Actinomycetes bacterium]
MTQDQYGQARGPGYVVRGDVVPEDETEDTSTGEPKPMTRFQKVASALRGGSEADEQDQAAADEAGGDQVSTDRTAADARAADAPADSESSPPWVTRQDEAAMAGSPISQESAAKRDYWDDADAAGHEDAVAATSPDTPADHQATEPDMFGTTRRTGEETAEMPAATAERQPGAATIADVPAARTPVTETTASETPAGETPTPAAGGELRPGDATANLGDFSDLTYGNLVPDATHYNEQWQQIQFRFVDDPHGSVTEAADVIAQVTAKMEAAIQERQRAIAEQQRTLRDRWGEGSNADTEALRATLRMYKTFLDQLIGPRAS